MGRKQKTRNLHTGLLCLHATQKNTNALGYPKLHGSHETCIAQRAKSLLIHHSPTFKLVPRTKTMKDSLHNTKPRNWETWKLRIKLSPHKMHDQTNFTTKTSYLFCRDPVMAVQWFRRLLVMARWFLAHTLVPTQLGLLSHTVHSMTLFQN